MSNPFFDHDEDELKPQLPPETIVINGARKSSQYVVISPSAEREPVRDALMLEVFLSTSIPPKTLTILTKLLNDRAVQTEQILAQMTKKAEPPAENKTDSLGFSPPLSEDEIAAFKEMEDLIQQLIDPETKSDSEEKKKPKRGRKPKRAKDEGE